MSKSTSKTMAEYVKTIDISTSDQHRLLAEERRRLALGFLANRTVVVELQELADEVATKEAVLHASDGQSVEHVLLSLHHCHLPKMDELGVIDYDADTNLVDPSGLPSTF